MMSQLLFRSIRYIPQHVLHQLLPPPKFTGYNPLPWTRPHPVCYTFSVHAQNFINRMLFNDDIHSEP